MRDSGRERNLVCGTEDPETENCLIFSSVDMLDFAPRSDPDNTWVTPVPDVRTLF